MFRVDRLEELLAEHNESAQDMLRQLNMGRNQFYEWKNNGRKPSIRAVAAMANHFGVSYGYLNGTTDDPGTADSVGVSAILEEINHAELTKEARKPAENKSAGLSKQEQEIIEIYRGLGLKQQMEFIQFITSL